MFYNMKNLLALAHVAVCNQLVLQDPALTMLELLIMEGHAAKNKANLKKTEQLLSECLEQMRCSSNERDSLLLIIKRLNNLLLMLRYEITVHCQAEKLPRSRVLLKNKAQEYVSNAEIFQKKTSKHLLQVVNDFCGPCTEDELYPRAKKLIVRSKPSQVAVIVECFKKIFLKMEVKILQFLKEFVSCKKSPPNECLAMIIHGLTLFLCHRLRTTPDRDINLICTAVMDVLNTTAEKNIPHEAKCMLGMLIFDMTPAIRQGIIEYFLRRKIYLTEFEQLLLTEITRMLCPFLNIETTKIMHNYNSEWHVVLGTFSHLPAAILFHKPKENSLWSKNETQIINVSDSMHLNQVKKLLILQHKNIITMYAYQTAYVPQFYVLEDYMTNNLQTALKNRNDNRRYFDQLTLMKFLTCVIEAIDYCHGKGIVHRNLTAESLFVVGDIVKLHGFSLAVSLGRHEEITEVKASSQIPTRWSAPESLSKLKFSRKSDVYMYGHFMYEILTHGALPYSHVKLLHENFVELVTTKQIHLCHEKCFTKDVYEEICKCVHFDAEKRPDTSTVRENLAILCNGTKTECKPRFPQLSETPKQSMRLPSTTFEKGTPRVDAVNYVNMYVEIPHKEPRQFAATYPPGPEISDEILPLPLCRGSEVPRDQCTVSDNNQNLITEAKSRFGHQLDRMDSQTTVKKTLCSDTMPKVVYQESFSRDSAFHSFTESVSTLKTGDVPSDVNLITESYMVSDYDYNDPSDSEESMQGLYVDVLNSSASTIERYNNILVPKRITCNTKNREQMYSEVEQFPLGYRYLKAQEENCNVPDEDSLDIYETIDFSDNSASSELNILIHHNNHSQSLRLGTDISSTDSSMNQTDDDDLSAQGQFSHCKKVTHQLVPARSSDDLEEVFV